MVRYVRGSCLKAWNCKFRLNINKPSCCQFPAFDIVFVFDSVVWGALKQDKLQ